MWEIKFRGSSSQGHVIHKVNFKVIEKVKRSMHSNMFQSRNYVMTDLDSLSNYLSINTNFMKIGQIAPEI